MRRFRFKLRTFLIVAPFAGAMIAWVASHLMRTEITADLEILTRPFLFWEGPKNPHVDLVEATPDDILFGAIESLSRKSRAWIEADGDPVRWIRRRVRITVIGDKLLRIAIVNHAPTPGETAVEKEVVNALARSFSEAQPSEFHKLFCLYPSGIGVRRWAWVNRHWF